VKRAVLALVALIVTGSAVVVGAPAAYAYPNCYHEWCQWVVNPGFENSSPAPWVPSPNATFPSNNICGQGTKVAKLKRTESLQKEWIYQRMYIDDAFSGPKAQVELKLDLRDDTNSAWDELRIIVKNLETNATETKSIKGNNYSTTCPILPITWDLASDYGGHNVELKLEIQSFSTGTFVLDDVFFWTH